MDRNSGVSVNAGAHDSYASPSFAGGINDAEGDGGFEGGSPQMRASISQPHTRDEGVQLQEPPSGRKAGGYDSGSDSDSDPAAPLIAQEGEKLRVTDYFRGKPVKLRACIALLGSFCLAYVNVSCPLPFLGDSLADRGIPQLWIGGVYAAHSFGIASSSLVTQRIEGFLGNRYMMVWGFLLAGSATIATAFALDIGGSSEAAILAATLSFRFAAGFGEGLADTSIMNYYQILFPEVLGQVLGLSEGMIGLGYALGPLIGGLLYDAAGWRLPFLVVACPFFVLAFVTPAVVHAAEAEMTTTAEDEASGSDEEAKPAAGEAEAAEEVEAGGAEKSTAIAVMVAVGIAINASAAGSMGPVLSQQLTNFYGLSKAVVGLIMGASGIVYWCAGYFIGSACDHYAHVKDYRGIPFIHGFIVMIVGYALLGPIPLPESFDSALHLDNHTVQLVVLLFGLAIGTISTAFSLIGGMAILTVRAKTTSQASAFFNGSLNFGYGLGPIALNGVSSAVNYRTAMAACSGSGVLYYITALIVLRLVLDMSR